MQHTALAVADAAAAAEAVAVMVAAETMWKDLVVEAVADAININ